MLYVGIDLGGTNIAVGIVDENGTILHKDETPTLVGRPYQEILHDMGQLALKVIGDSGHTLDEVAGIGAGVPGVANEDGVVVFATNLFWHNVPMADELHKYLPGKPIFIDNDGNVAGLAEYFAGVSKGTKNSVFLTLGTGVGGGFVVDGKLVTGSHHVGAEIGHMVIAIDGEQCTCGNKGCWERYTSATALIARGKEAAQANPTCLIAQKCGGDLEKIDARIVIDSARELDPVAVKIFDDYAYYMAIGLVNIVNIFDPEVIALGGGVSRAGDFLLDAIRKKTDAMVMYKTMPYARIEIAQLGNDAGIIGAAMLCK